MNAASYLLNMLELDGGHPEFAWLAELALKSTLLLLLTLALSVLLHSASAARRHLLWCLCILTLASLPVFISFVPEFTLAVPMATSADSASPVTSAAGTAARPAAWTTVVVQFYFVGLLLLLVYSCSGIARMFVLGRQAQRCANPLALRQLDDILKSELTNRSVDLRVHPALRSPLSWGLLRPMIMLPPASATWTADRMRHVLLHEMSHIRRLDWVTQLIGRYACALCWYNPLVWYAARAMNELAEQACDDAVLLNDCSHTAYASDLVALAKTHTPRGKAGYLAQALASSFLGSRIVAILDTARLRTHNDSAWVLRAVLLAFTGVALLGALQIGPPAALAEFGSSLGRYITVNFLPAPSASGTGAGIVVHAQPERMAALRNVLPEGSELRLTTRTVGDLRNEFPDRVPQIVFETLPGIGPDHSLRLLQKALPAYPAAAVARGLEGQVTLEYEISATGEVVDVLILDSAPGSVFNQSALDAIREYRFEPARVNGQPVGIQGLRARFIFEIDPEPG